jgi:hypothetical protein
MLAILAGSATTLSVWVAAAFVFIAELVVAFEVGSVAGEHPVERAAPSMPTIAIRAVRYIVWTPYE